MSSAAVVPDDEITQAQADLDGRSPEAILGWAARRFAPRIQLATGFGVEGSVLIDLIARHGLAIEIFTLDTGVLFPETYALWRRLERRYGVTIRALRPALSIAGQAAAHGERLWERDPDRCCGLRKLEPLRQHLAGLDAWVTAIRRDQTPERADALVVEWDARHRLIKINPLVAWTADQVWAYVRAHDVPANPLYERGYASIGCQPCTTPVLAGEDPRAGRWRGSEKRECGLHLGGARRAALVFPHEPLEQEQAS